MKFSNHIVFKSAAITLCLLMNFYLKGQPIAIDRGIKIEGLWCFPLVTDSSQYKYLPDEAQLSVDEKNRPQFSFIRYTTGSEDVTNSFTQAKGGGILTFLVQYKTDENKVKAAERGLKQRFKNDRVRLQGPIIFTDGRYALVSSILNSETRQTENNLLSIGAAPVMEGSRLAFSFVLDPKHSNLLLQSLMTKTPDLSLVFDLNFTGLTDAYNAKLIVNWNEVQKNQKIGGGMNVYFVSAEVEVINEELKRANAIKLETSGEDPRMESLLTMVYNKITELLYRPVQPENLPAEQQSVLGNLLTSVIGAKKGSGSGGGISAFGAHFAYKLRELKKGGSDTLIFNSRLNTARHHYIAFNIGDFYKKYGNNEDYFRVTNLTTDTAFIQRNISVGIDLELLPEMDKMINNITVTLKKVHGNGNVTVREVRISKSDLENYLNKSMSYGWDHDGNEMSWLNYEYRASYSFKGGMKYDTDWIRENGSNINLWVPYKRMDIRLDGDPAILKSKQVRAVTVRIEYPFFSEKKIHETTIRPNDDISNQIIGIILPRGQNTYRYTIKWWLNDGTQKIAQGQNDSEYLPVDLIPD